MAVPQGPDSEPPIHNLVRFIDVDVEPGDTYEYRVQVRMGNPNFKRNKEVASPSYADGADLTSDWSKIPIQVKVPEEQNCYVVDQYKADNPNARPIASEDRTRMIPVQIHKWLQTSGLATQNMPVGDWGIAERVPVYRGEFIGRPCGFSTSRVLAWFPPRLRPRQEQRLAMAIWWISDLIARIGPTLSWWILMVVITPMKG
jgi:hypothetical protein